MNTCVYIDGFNLYYGSLVLYVHCWYYHLCDPHRLMERHVTFTPVRVNRVVHWSRRLAMAMDNLTFELGGEVSLNDLADSFLRLKGLIGALTSEVSAKARVSWVVEDLRPGSAAATIRGEAEDPEDVARVVKAYAVVGQALERNEPIPFSQKVRRHAEEIMTVLHGNITSIRFETPEVEWTVVSPAVKVKLGTHLSAFGAVEGRIETLTKRKGLRFILYDTIHDRAVACYLKEGQEEQMRGAWGRRAIVEGWVTRDPVSGRPATIRQVSKLTFLAETVPGSYRNARGAVPAGPEDPSPEDLIRRLRDA